MRLSQLKKHHWTDTYGYHTSRANGLHFEIWQYSSSTYYVLVRNLKTGDSYNTLWHNPPFKYLTEAIQYCENLKELPNHD